MPKARRRLVLQPLKNQVPGRTCTQDVDDLAASRAWPVWLGLPEGGRSVPVECLNAELHLDHTASDKLEKVKSRTTIGGIMLPLTRCGFPSASRLFRKMTGLSLNRKFLIAYFTSPFST